MKLSEDSKNFQYVKNVVELMKERVSTVSDFIEFGSYFFSEPFEYDEKGLAKHWNREIKPIFIEYSGILKNTGKWVQETLEKDLRGFAVSKGVKAGELIHLLRLSLTGLTISPGIFELMKLLGKDRVTQRIAVFLERN
jgi:glutamyl/glutaminyl-tRNA synthetase